MHFYGIADSTRSVDNYAAISGNGQDRSYTYIYIYDGAELTSNGHALYVPQPGDVYISGGTLTGSGAIGMKSGKSVITGGTLIATGEYDENIQTNSNGIENDGSVINIDSNSSYAGEMIIEIGGDAVLRSTNGHAIREIGKDEDQTSVVSLDITNGSFIAADDKNALVLRDITEDNVAVSGGSYSSPVAEEYLADRINYELNSGDGYSYYPTIGEAIDAATEQGGVISSVGQDPAATTHTVALDYDYHGLENLSVEVANETEFTLPDATRSGYDLVGWEDEDGDTYDVGDEIEITRDREFTAIWEEIDEGEYRIRIVVTGNGSVESSDNYADEGDRITLTGRS